MKLSRGIVCAVFVCCLMFVSVAGAAEFKDPIGTLLPQSKFYQDFFPQPLLMDSITPDDQVAGNIFYGGGSDWQTEVSAEIAWSYHLLTLDAVVPYKHVSVHDDSADGFGPISLSARHPVYQHISDSGLLDYTVGARAEFGVGTDTELAKDNEFVIGAYQALAIGERFSIQFLTQYSFLVGADHGGATNFEYDLVFGYELHTPFWRLEKIVPMIEIDAATGVGGEGQGPATWIGVLGADFRFNRKSFGQPVLGLGFVYPLNDNAEHEFDWGVTTRFILQF